MNFISANSISIGNGTMISFELLLSFSLNSMIAIDSISSFVDMINHVHLSELNLEVLSKSNFDFYKQLLKTLKLNNYSKVISIEMKNTKLENIENTIKFVKEIIEGIEND